MSIPTTGGCAGWADQQPQPQQHFHASRAGQGLGKSRFQEVFCRRERSLLQRLRDREMHRDAAAQRSLYALHRREA